MSFFRMLFVLLLCLPITYLVLRLTIGLIDQLTAERKAQRKVRKRRDTGYGRNHGKRTVHNRRRY